MQTFIAKYMTAAHLAILAVAPLFLFNYLTAGEMLTACLWLSLYAALWVAIEPSVIGEESLRSARHRVIGGVLKDAFFWVLAAVVVFAWARAYNLGVAMGYDPEAKEWCLKMAEYDFFPGCVGEEGKLALAGAVIALVVVTGCRHALGKSARMAFLLMASSFAAVSAVAALVLLKGGDKAMMTLAEGGIGFYSYLGTVYWIYALAGTAVLVGLFDQKWNVFKTLLIPVLGALMAGGFVFAPMVVSIAFASAMFVLMGWGFYWLFRRIRGSAPYRMLAIFAVAVVAGMASVYFSLGDGGLEKRLETLKSGELIGADFKEARSALSRMAAKSWREHPWIGTGMGSFALDVRFAADDEDWKFVKGEVREVANGWWQLLVERGIIGVVAILVPLVILLAGYIKRAVEWGRNYTTPMPVVFLAPLALGLTLSLGAFDCAMLRIEVMTALAAMLALSARSFPRTRGR